MAAARELACSDAYIHVRLAPDWLPIRATILLVLTPYTAAREAVGIELRYKSSWPVQRVWNNREILTRLINDPRLSTVTRWNAHLDTDRYKYLMMEFWYGRSF